ncbi:type IV pilus assembly protein PilC [Desulfonauticus submarinus]|uniref:Type IV pilus assembly protein PilC n=1 Tax=Desulfonauticus submarinus TaxID=206665 RepID=A0A1H0DIN1_9BACT|nr:type II secretion system F family protein [Desulfonauticus submarinus]SDN69983.1 type IV pilus assembly protein PilC [Desulfonauticus submarinus]
MEYKYTAITEDGELIEGVIQANSKENAESILLEKDLYPQKIEENFDSISKNSIWKSLKSKLFPLKTPELIIFTKQFRTMFKAGLSIVEILSILENQVENIKLQEIIIEMKKDIQEGKTLYQAFSKHPKTFSRLYCAMIRAGETSGSLVEVMNRLCYLLDHEYKVKQDIKSALQYPMIVLIALTGAFFFLLTFVIPKFVLIFKNAGIQLPLPTVMALNLYHFLITYWYLCLLFLIGTIVSLALYFKTKQGKIVRDTILLKTPIIGPVFQKAAMSRFSSIFAILQASGIGVLKSIDILSDTIGNAAISQQFENIREKLKEGRGISGPLKSAKFFTPMVISMIAVGEETGNLDEMLSEISKHYDEEVEYAVQKMSTNIGPILIVGLAAVVGFFALAIFMPMWDLTKMAAR